MKTRTKLRLALLVPGVHLLHQDCWNWTRVEPLVFGVPPVGLAYHGACAVLAAVLMALLVEARLARRARPHRSRAAEQGAAPQSMIPTVVVCLAIVVDIGIFAFRKGQTSGEDCFLAGRVGA